MKTIATSTIAILFMVLALSGKAKADLATDLKAIADQAGDLQIQLEAVQLTGDTVCAPLVAASQAARSLVENIQAFNKSMSGPFAIDDALLETVKTLSATNTGLAEETLRLAIDLSLLAPSSNAITIKGGITAMLQLSEDIGTMADRIGEMADKILVMADNIGLMADRTLITQEIQSQNIAMTQATLLQTQTNILTLVSAVETDSYNLTLDSLVSQGELLAADLSATVFSPLTIKYQLAAAADDVVNFRDQILAMFATIEEDSTISTMIIDDSTMLAMNNMAIMASSFATVLDSCTLAIESMVGVLTNRNLSVSIDSMLEMSADIGVMANSILEMADHILAMADNIGLTADQILLTQQLQSDYMAIIQAAILSTQERALNIIVAEAL